MWLHDDAKSALANTVHSSKSLRSSFRKLIIGLTTLVLALGVSLGLVEGLLRLIDPPMAYPYRPQRIIVSHFRSSAFLPFELRPNRVSHFSMLEFDTIVRTNSWGLRDDELLLGKTRMMCLGDSFTFGVGVENEETFCAQLERLFDGRYEFLNGGFADGYSPDTYAVWLAKMGKEVDPMLILVSIFQNDLEDVNSHSWIRTGQPMGLKDHGLPEIIRKSGHVVTPDGAWMRDTVIAKLPPWIRSALKESYMVGFLRDRLLRDVQSLPNLPTDPDREGDAAAAPKPSGHSVVKDQYLAQEGLSSEARYTPQDRKFMGSLNMIRDAAGERKLVFYLIPSRGQKTLSRMDQLVTIFAQTHHIPVLSNFEDFEPDDYFEFDEHWRPSGHQKAAQYLYRELSKLGI